MSTARRSSYVGAVESRRPGSIQIKKWGLVHGWLAGAQGRGIVIEASADGLSVRVLDPPRSATDEVAVDEDPSGAAWRAIARLARELA